MADLRISELPALPGAALAAAELLPLTDVSASQTKKITAKDLIQYGVTLIDANSIPSDKFDIVLASGSVTEATLQDGSVTALKLDDNSSCVVSIGIPATGERIGQLAVDTTANKLFAWSGSRWLEVKAAGSINTITPDATGLVVLAVTPTGDTVAINAELANTAGARQFLAGPTASGGTVTQRVIVSADLPTATAADKGAVLPGTSLEVDAAGILEIKNSVTPQITRSLATWNEFGLVTGGTPIEGADLPAAQPTIPGVVYPGDGLAVDPFGQLFIDNSVIPGTYPKVTVNAKGLVVNGGPLEATDITSIDAATINSGEISTSVIADRSIEEIKLADYSTCYVQEGQPSGDAKLGQLWFTPSTNQLRIYTRGSAGDRYESIGFGALQTQNLRWGGTINADTSTIVSLTDIGVSEGLTAGGPIPTPTDELSGIYFVVQVAGSGIALLDVTGKTFTEGDWLLCINQAQGYTSLDIAAGGGGGGGASKLVDLTDVDVTTPMADEWLAFDAISATWKNVNTLDGGSF